MFEVNRSISGIVIAFLFISMLVLTFNVQPAKSEYRTWTVDDDKPADFHTIQEAVNHANEGDTVYVKKGTYYGLVDIYKSLNLIGEDRATTIINANSTPQAATEGIFVHHGAGQVVIRGFTVKNGFWGVLLGNVFTVLSHNIITDNMDGIRPGFGNKIVDNEITSNFGDGVYMRGVDNCTFYGNTFERNGRCGVWAGDCYGNIFVANTFSNNAYGISLEENSANNTLYHNNFINNTDYQIDIAFSGQNILDDGYPSGGNYWSDYVGNDSFSGPYQNMIGSDGLGDIPYQTAANSTDMYPLIRPYVPLGDLNLDMKVDLADSFIFVLAFGSQPISLEWDSRADLNGDCSVNILDAIILGNNFGKSYL
jgi:parallel beta-helix repeat protein